jgi:hypothetical protein
LVDCGVGVEQHLHHVDVARTRGKVEWSANSAAVQCINLSVGTKQRLYRLNIARRRGLGKYMKVQVCKLGTPPRHHQHVCIARDTRSWTATPRFSTNAITPAAVIDWTRSRFTDTRRLHPSPSIANVASVRRVHPEKSTLTRRGSWRASAATQASVTPSQP